MPFTSALRSSKRSDWETPPDFFSALHAEFGFTLDVCAHAQNHKCEAYFSEEEDGLAQSWSGVCWMNPPYGRVIKQWIAKAFHEAEVGHATVVCLVPARTDTSWWHDYCAKGEVRFVRGRLRFVDAPAPAPFPCAVVIFRCRDAGWTNPLQSAT